MREYNLDDNVFNSLPSDPEIYESYLIGNSKIKRYQSDDIMVSISGGSDSDIMLDIVSKIDNNVHFVFFDTGIEYQATKDNIKFLENKYKIKIEIEKAKIPVPIGCRTYGQPFLSKHVSDNIERLQSHNFQWEDKNFETLYERYPKCKSALRWWCNCKTSTLNISRNKWLKEFLIENPPTFAISSKCCKGAKKDVAKAYHKAHGIKLDIVGIRKAEGGTRATIPNCFTERADGVSQYRPLFWYKNENKRLYDEYYNITHSRCYSEYGLKRTGCAGCPFGQDFENELNIIAQHEPKLFKAVNKIFGDSYEYTRRYREFVRAKEGAK